MTNYVQRFIIKAHPSPDNILYYEWQTAHIVIFVGEDNRQKSLEIAKQKLRQEHWVPIEFIEKSTLVEDRVRGDGGEVWEAYRKAKEGQLFFIVIIDDDFMFSRKGGICPMLPPRITETFIDKVIEKAGGHRLSKSEADPDKIKNPDYKIGNYLLELKDLQKEGLDVETRRNKLTEFFVTTSKQKDLTRSEYSKFFNILGGPVKGKVREAAHQIRDAKHYIGDSTLEGAILYLNTGYYSLSHELFCQIVEKMAAKYSDYISLVMCISNMVDTNGYESIINFHFYPGSGVNETECRIHSAFMSEIGAHITEWSRAGFKNSQNPAVIRKPNVFERDGEYFGYVPDPLECSINKK